VKEDVAYMQIKRNILLNPGPAGSLRKILLSVYDSI
jgi:hypothetical protein